jgi:hypothetical protein
MRRDLLRPGKYGQFMALPLPRIVKWQEEADGKRDASELLAQSYPVREDVIPHLKQIYEAFNGVEVGEVTSVIDTLGPASISARLREMSERRMRYVIEEDCAQNGRAVVMWYKMEEKDHPITGTHQRLLILRVLTIPMLTSWEY